MIHKSSTLNLFQGNYLKFIKAENTLYYKSGDVDAITGFQLKAHMTFYTLFSLTLTKREKNVNSMNFEIIPY